MQTLIKDKIDNISTSYLDELLLYNFRNYSSFRIKPGNLPMVITGKNGSGKTNILEAISMLSPGRGLRGAPIKDMARIDENGSIADLWSVNFHLHNYNDYSIVVGANCSEEEARKIIKIDGKTARSSAELSECVTIDWVIPQMDYLFTEPASSRRKFIDRITQNFHFHHSNLLSEYEKLLRSRAKLLRSSNYDRYWLNSIELQMAELAIEIAANRLKTCELLNHYMEQLNSGFPKCRVSLIGDTENSLESANHAYVEEYYQDMLLKNRQIDIQTNRTNFGIHRTDLAALHLPRNMEASYCSTGEQKALLISITLSAARAKIAKHKAKPIILLDELMVHFDESKRDSLLEELYDLKLQFWLTGTDISLYEALRGRANFLEL